MCAELMRYHVMSNLDAAPALASLLAIYKFKAASTTVSCPAVL